MLVGFIPGCDSAVSIYSKPRIYPFSPICTRKVAPVFGRIHNVPSLGVESFDTYSVGYKGTSRRLVCLN